MAKDSPKQSALRAGLGTVLHYTGLAGVAIGFGMTIGFFAADRGVRWLPTMLKILLLIAILSLAVIVAGLVLDGSATRLTPKGTFR